MALRHLALTLALSLGASSGFAQGEPAPGPAPDDETPNDEVPTPPREETPADAPAPEAVNSPTPEAVIDEDERARQLYLQGDALYARGLYEKAIAAFEEAYALSQRPALLFNIGNAQERMGDWPAALESFRAYLPHARPGQEPMVQGRIDSLEARIARVEAERRSHQAQHEADHRRLEAARREAAQRPSEEAPGDSPSPRGPLMLTSAGLFAIAGVVAGVVALQARAEVRERCAPYCRGSVREFERRDRNASISADVLLGLGAISLGLGLYWTIHDRRSSEPALSVALGPASIHLEGEF